MAPPAPINCYAPNCDYVTAAECTTIAQALQFMSLHVQAAHPAPVAAAPGPRPTTKVEHWTRPEISMDTSERDWRFFLAEWEDYKRATAVTGTAVLDELWSCMASDLKKLAFDQGGKVALLTEQLMLARIKSLAVTVLHSAVHTVHLHDSKQLAEESTKAFAARVRGTAASCELTKICPTADCNTNVSFMEETVYNVTLAVLRDREMQERCLAAAYMKTVTNIQELIQFCSAEESSKKSSSDTVGALRTSTYRQVKKEKAKQNQGNTAQTSKPRCTGCGGPEHPVSRRKQCKAWGQTCSACGTDNHFAAACRGGGRPPPVRNAAVEPSQQSSQLGGELASYAFCALNTSPTPAAEVPCADHYPQSYSPPEYRGLSPGSEVPILPFDSQSCPPASSGLLPLDAAQDPCAVDCNPQSYSPPEHWGQSPGSEVPILQSDEQSRSCSSAGCQIRDAAAQVPCAALCHQKSYSPPEYRGLSAGSEVPIIPFDEQSRSCSAAGCQAVSVTAQAPCAATCHQKSYSAPEYRGLSSGSEVPIVPFGEQSQSPSSAGCQTGDAAADCPCAADHSGVLTPKHCSPPEYRGLGSGQIIPNNAATSNLTPDLLHLRPSIMGLTARSRRESVA